MFQQSQQNNGNLMALTIWKTEQPGYEEWMHYMKLEGKSAERMCSQLLRTAVFDICQYSQEDIPTVCNEIMGGGGGEAIYGLCDEYHSLHLECLKWIRRYIDVPKTKGKVEVNNVLDYYGKTGEFAFRVAKSTGCKVSFVDQNPWLDYAKFRFRLKGLHYSIRSIEATPAKPRPEITETTSYDPIQTKYGFIMTPDIPQATSQEYMEWLHRHCYPLALVACKAELPLKIVAKLPAQCTMYQIEP